MSVLDWESSTKQGSSLSVPQALKIGTARLLQCVAKYQVHWKKKNQVFWPDNILLRSRVFRAFQSMFHTPPLFSLRKWIYYLQYFATLFQEFSPMGTNLATFTLTILQWRLPFYFLVKSEEGRKGLSWLNSEPQAAFKVVTLYDSKRNDGSVNELELRGRAL